jgi:hypothetical protein
MTREEAVEKRVVIRARHLWGKTETETMRGEVWEAQARQARRRFRPHLFYVEVQPPFYDLSL